MHNKFVVVDNEFVLTGSFNWTVQAASENQENLAIIDDAYFVFEYAEEFKKLWNLFSDNAVEVEQAKTQEKRKFNKNKSKYNNY